MEENLPSADDLIITDRLSERPSRAPDYAAESRALEALAKELAERPENLLQKLADTIVELGIGDSAGVSIEETAEVRQFRWVALAGVWGQLRGSTIPFDASPCGLAVRRDHLLLIESPERFYAEARVEPLIHEGLLVPFHIAGRPVGTLWINVHSPDRMFDREDARLLQGLARFASAGYQMTLALQSSEAGRLESDTRLRALAHASSDVFYVMSADMRELRELSGGNFIPDTTSPSRDWLRDYIPPEDHAQTLGAIGKAIRTKGVFELEHRVRRVDGEVGWAMSRAVPIFGANGEIVEWFGAATDIAERKRAEMAQRENEGRQAYLLKLSDALRSVADPVAIQEVAARALGEHLGATRVAYVEVIEDHYVIARDYTNGAPSMVGRYPVSEFGGGKVADYRSGETRVVHNTNMDVHNQPADNANFAAFHIRAGIGAPLIKDGDFIANLVVHMDAPRDWTPDEVALVEETAQRTWAAVERARAEAALRESEARLAAAFATVPVGLAVIDMSGKVTTANDDYLRFLPGGVLPSRDPTAVRRWRAWDAEGRLLEPNDYPGARAIRGEHVLPGQEMLFTTDDGREVWTYVASVPIRDAGGQVTAQASVISDIDETKRTADALRESEARYRSLFQSIDDGYALIEFLPEEDGRALDFRFVEVNASFERQTGNQDVPGRLGSEINPGDDAVWIEMFGEVARSSLPKRFEIHHRQTGRWYNAFATPVGDVGSRQVCVVFADTTERKKREERQTFLLRFSDALRAEEGPEAVGDKAVRMIAAELALDRAYFVTVDLEESRISVTHEVRREHMAPMLGSYHSDDFPNALREFLERPITYTDVRSDPRLSDQDRLSFTGLGAAGFAAVPIRRGNAGLIWAVGAVSTEPRAWTPNDIDLLEDAAERAWAAIERALAEGARRESEERLLRFGEASQDILWIRDAATLQWTYLTPAFEAIYGLSREEALSGDDYRNWQDLIVSDDRAHAVAAIERVLEGEQVTFEYRVRRPSDGAIRWLRNTDFPITDGSGKVVSIGGVGHDMTDLKAVQAAITASEGRLRTLMEGIPQLVWRSCAEGRWTWASPQWLDFTGQRQEESHGLGWLKAVHPDDDEATMLAWEDARPHGMLDVEYRVRRAADGAWLWHHTRSVPVRDAEGTIIEWLGTTTDIHALRELQERQGVLVAELQHRTRNLITVVRSLSDRTVGNAASLDDFKGRFGRRLAALSRVQGLLSHLSAGERVDFGELLRSELTALGVADGKGERVTLDGPADVPLRSATVQTLALAIHELSTNAVKYGALAADAASARLAVRWHVEPATADDPPVLHVEWRESGVIMPHVGAPARGGGYGRELIERALPYQLGAETTYELGVDGVRCTIEMPISREIGHAE